MWKVNTDFHHDWTTYGRHRVLISVRDGYPSGYEHEVAKMVARLLDNGEEEFERARLVYLFHDDTHGYMTIHIATDQVEYVTNIEEDTRNLLSLLYGMHSDSQLRPIVEAVKQGSIDSDHYDHMAYLASQLMRGED
jgi:hypothetical protein